MRATSTVLAKALHGTLGPRRQYHWALPKTLMRGHLKAPDVREDPLVKPYHLCQLRQRGSESQGNADGNMMEAWTMRRTLLESAPARLTTTTPPAFTLEDSLTADHVRQSLQPRIAHTPVQPVALFELIWHGTIGLRVTQSEGKLAGYGHPVQYTMYSMHHPIHHILLYNNSMYTV